MKSNSVNQSKDQSFSEGENTTTNQAATSKAMALKQMT